MRRLLLLFIFVLCLSLPGCSLLPQVITTNPQTNILTARNYPKLLIEVIYVSGFNAPTKADLDYLKSKVKQYCHKETVELVISPEIPYSKIPTLCWSSSDLTYFEFKHAKYTTVGDTLVIHILYVPGVDYPDLIVRGRAYGDYAFVLFRQQFSQDRERAVLLHEFGHLMGLVNCGTPCQTDHQERDPAHRPHCRNEKCIMYWSSPDGQFPDFDASCKLDIIGNGGK